MKSGMTEKSDIYITQDSLAFITFCIENMAIRHSINAKDVYVAWRDKSDILMHYIVPGYEFLHTQDKEYILDDIEEVMQRKGVSF